MNSPVDTAGATPGLWRRIACLVYESLLVFGVMFGLALLYAILTDQRHALQGRSGLEMVIFVVLGSYFVWCWTHGGQTLAMRTWHIRLVDRDGRPVTPARAVARYLLSWMWFLPAMLTLYLVGLQSLTMVSVVVLAGVAGYAMLARFNRERQFWHDIACGTRLVTWHPPPRA